MPLWQVKLKRNNKNKHSARRNVHTHSYKQIPGAKEKCAIFLTDSLNQLSRLKSTLFICFVFALIMLSIVFLLHKTTGLPFSALSRDMAAVCNVKAYIGFLSNIGIILWSTVVGICFFSAMLIRQNANQKNLIAFFLWSGVLTLQLALDDVLLFHDRIFPNYLQIPERLVHCAYACATILWLILFLKVILSTDFLLLFVAGGLLAASMFADQFTQFSEMETIIEDSLKFIGIIFWLAYFVRSGLQHVRETITPVVTGKKRKCPSKFK